MFEDVFQIKVKLWGTHVGTLRWDRNAGRSIFAYSEEYLESPYDLAPTLYSKKSRKLLSFYGSKAAEGLPEFLADSLPDDWGNILYDRWTTRHRIPTNDFRVLSKLSFIGKRAMGALEFEPETDIELSAEDRIAIDELYEQALHVLNDRYGMEMTTEEEISIARLIQLGTSVGGKHAKGLIAISPQGTIRSGQVELPPEYKYYILKFKEDKDVPTSEIEKIYYDMASECDIQMMPSELYPAGGTNHFLTERFDRKPGGEKIHTQTLRALAPEANDYTNLFWLCSRLNIPQQKKEMLFRQMVFNHFAGVTDDHSKNFTFIMDRSGTWDLSPAYDLMFTANIWKDASAYAHCLGVGGKFSHLTKDDFVEYGKDFELEGCKRTVDRIADVLTTFPERCRQYGINGPWTEKIWNVIRDFLPPREKVICPESIEREDTVSKIRKKFQGKEYLQTDRIILKTNGRESGEMIHFTVDGKKKTCVSDYETGDVCISPGHIRNGELHMGIWKTLDGKPASYTPTRVISLSNKKKLDR